MPTTTPETSPLSGTRNRSPKAWLDALLLLICCLLVGVQLFIPPIVGLTDNGDFFKVTGRLDLGPVRIWSGFHSTYTRADKYHLESNVISSELVPAWIASRLSQIVDSGDVFDIRYLGLVHALLFVAAFLCVLRFLHTIVSSAFVRLLSAMAFLLIFTDVLYVSYFNSFYSDAVAVVSLLLMTSAALSLLAENSETRWSTLVLFGVGAILFITSKGQHGVWGVFPAMVLLVPAVAARSRSKKVQSAVLCAILLITTFIEIRITPAAYKGQALFNLIFVKIAPAFPNPAFDLWAFGLTADYAKYVGFTAYQENNPIPDQHSQEVFAVRTGYSRIARYYLRHPRRAVAILVEDLRTNAIHIRDPFLSNYPTGSGIPVLARHFDSWSSLRTSMFNIWPAHICVWYLAFLACAAWLAIKTPNSSLRRLALIGIGLAVIGILEFVFASLADGVETDRHLLLFHEFTDLTMWLSLTALAAWVAARKEHRLDTHSRDSFLAE